MGSPMGMVQVAVDSLVSGGTVVLAKGAHWGPLILPAGITVRGACAEQTQLSSMSLLEPAVVTMTGGNLRDLSISGSDIGIQIENTNELVR